MDKVANMVRDANFVDKIHRMAEIFPKISELSIDTNKVLEKIVKIVAEVFETDVLVLFRYDERTKKIISPPIYTGDIKHKEALEADVIFLEVPFLLIKGGKSHYVDHSQEDPIMTLQKKAFKKGAIFVFREKIVSSAGIILRVGHEIVGVMFINYRTPHEFNADERQIIEVFASYIAIAIQNVKQFSEKKVSDVMQTIGKITSNFAHKLKNDIGTINLYAGDLLDEIKPGHPQYFPISQIKKKISKINADIGHLQRASKLAIHEKKPTDINDLMAELQSDISPDLKIKKIELEIQISPDITEIEIDPVQIKLVLWNLAMNSIEAMPEGGKILISISKLQKSISIELTDSGPGISPENAQKIFDVFWTTKNKGYGLGLFYANVIIDEHCGTISIDSNYTKGARFLIELPRKQE